MLRFECRLILLIKSAVYDKQEHARVYHTSQAKKIIGIALAEKKRVNDGVEHLGRKRMRDEGSFRAAYLDGSVGHQYFNCLAHGVFAHGHHLGKLHLRRELIARLVVPRENIVDYSVNYNINCRLFFVRRGILRPFFTRIQCSDPILHSFDFNNETHCSKKPGRLQQ